MSAFLASAFCFFVFLISKFTQSVLISLDFLLPPWLVLSQSPSDMTWDVLDKDFCIQPDGRMQCKRREEKPFHKCPNRIHLDAKGTLCNSCYLRMMVYFIMYWREINATEKLLFLYRYVIFLYLSSFSIWSLCTVLYCHLSPLVPPFSFISCPLSSMLKLQFI